MNALPNVSCATPKGAFYAFPNITGTGMKSKQLEEAGAVAVMPLGAPIGSGLGIQNQVTIRLIVEGAKVPVLVDAGVGTASDAAVAMELGCDGVLMNTAIAEAKDPILMARAMKLAVEAGLGREAFERVAGHAVQVVLHVHAGAGAGGRSLARRLSLASRSASLACSQPSRESRNQARAKYSGAAGSSSIRPFSPSSSNR